MSQYRTQYSYNVPYTVTVFSCLLLYSDWISEGESKFSMGRTARRKSHRLHCSPSAPLLGRRLCLRFLRRRWCSRASTNSISHSYLWTKGKWSVTLISGPEEASLICVILVASKYWNKNSLTVEQLVVYCPVSSVTTPYRSSKISILISSSPLLLGHPGWRHPTGLSIKIPHVFFVFHMLRLS